MTLDEIKDEEIVKTFVESAESRGSIAAAVLLVGEVTQASPNQLSMNQQIGGHPKVTTEIVKKFLLDTPPGQQILAEIMESKLSELMEKIEKLGLPDLTGKAVSENQDELDF